MVTTKQKNRALRTVRSFSKYATGKALVNSGMAGLLFGKTVQAIANSGLAHEANQGASSADYGISHSNVSTITKAASNRLRIESVLDVGSLVRAYCLSQGDSRVIFDSWSATFEFWATAPFSIQPILAIMENGETITASSANLNNVAATLDTALGSQSQERHFGPIQRASVTYINGTPYWHLTVTIDLMPIIPRYANSCIDREFTEDSPAYLELFLALVASGGPTSELVINYDVVQNWSYHSVDKKLKIL